MIHTNIFGHIGCERTVRVESLHYRFRGEVVRLGDFHRVLLNAPGRSRALVEVWLGCGWAGVLQGRHTLSGADERDFGAGQGGRPGIGHIHRAEPHARVCDHIWHQCKLQLRNCWALPLTIEAGSQRSLKFEIATRPTDTREAVTAEATLLYEPTGPPILLRITIPLGGPPVVGYAPPVYEPYTALAARR